VDSIISPFVLYLCLALGGIGVGLTLPRGRPTPQLIGGLIAATFFGLIILTLSVKAGLENLPNVFFYVFGFLALASAVRVITHSKPVYSALYFVLTILSSAGLYLLLYAEFLTFALIIIYAGAILITYLFVIMLATQTPSEQEYGALSEYDAVARDPIIATGVGFTLLAALTGMLATGVTGLPEVDAGAEAANPNRVLAELPRKVQRAFERVGFDEDVVLPLRSGEVGSSPVRSPSEEILTADASIYDPTGGPDDRGIALLKPVDPDAFLARLRAATNPEEAEAGVEPLPEGAVALIRRVDEFWVDPANVEQIFGLLRGEQRTPMIPAAFPSDLRGENIELVGFALLAEHPLAVELAGVILLLAMIGAVILSRKQMEAAARHRSTLGASGTMYQGAAA